MWTNFNKYIFEEYHDMMVQQQLTTRTTGFHEENHTIDIGAILNILETTVTMDQ